jgi:hypothetical protein
MTRLFTEVKEAQALGHQVKVALIGPLTIYGKANVMVVSLIN